MRNLSWDANAGVHVISSARHAFARSGIIRLRILKALANEALSFKTFAQMIHPEKVVSIHPYFRVRAGEMAKAKDLLRQMVARTSTESGNLYYDFTINDDVVFCREAYVEAEALLKHLENVGPVLAEFLKMADVLRVEVHGARASLEKLKSALADLKPEWFVFECGVTR